MLEDEVETAGREAHRLGEQCAEAARALEECMYTYVCI